MTKVDLNVNALMDGLVSTALSIACVHMIVHSMASVRMVCVFVPMVMRALTVHWLVSPIL